jgi:predicted nuclease of restriction endonuclease-like (RecB) superfamily
MDNQIHLSVDFIQQLKSEILKSRYIVAKIANAESLRLYFNIGRIVDKSIRNKQWGSKVLDTISTQLQQELPGLRGFSGKNLSKMRSFYLAWKDSSLIDSLLTSQLEKQTSNTLSSSVTSKIYDNTFEVSKKEFFSVSFTHHYEIILKIKDENSRWYYINLTATQFLTVQQLRHELQNNSHLQELKLPNNFQQTLPEVLSNKALRAFKDQYLPYQFQLF